QADGVVEVLHSLVPLEVTEALHVVVVGAWNGRSARRQHHPGLLPEFEAEHGLEVLHEVILERVEAAHRDLVDLGTELAERRRVDEVEGGAYASGVALDAAGHNEVDAERL